MRVLWLINIILPSIAEATQTSSGFSGGWLVGLSNALQAKEDVELIVSFPHTGIFPIQGKTDWLSYYGFSRKSPDPTKYDPDLESEFIKVITSYQPDIIHVWGTEFPHTLAMVRAANKTGVSDKVVISIQGLCSIISKHYLSGIPAEIQKKKTFRDFLKNENLLKQRDDFEKRGGYEVEALRKVKHVDGRTTWDKVSALQINPGVKYHISNRILRDSFYENQWDMDACERFSIFLSQGSYPIKGLHFMLEAMPLILKKYPGVRLMVAGRDITKSTAFKDRIRLSSYAKYILSLIKKYKLGDHINFVGSLNEDQMVEQYLKAHVFVSASTIENSPNSVGEAMLLGVPIVASNVGGVSDMLVHQQEGFTYQHDAPYMLAYYVCQIFGSDELALEFSKNARQHALQTHNREKNLSSLLRIYDEISRC